MPDSKPNQEPRYAKRLEIQWVVDKTRDVSGIDVSDPEKVAEHFRSMIGDSYVEKFAIIMLDPHLNYLCESVLNVGTHVSTQVDVGGILREVLITGGFNVIMCHNHPSGNTQPSLADDKTTAMMILLCQVCGLQLLDHIIIGDNGNYVSYFFDRKEIWETLRLQSERIRAQ